MIIGIGIDLVDMGRMRKAIERGGDRFMRRVFSAAERESAGDPPALETLAARFAAKEAALKALGTGWSAGIGWHEVEVTGDLEGRPTLRLSGQAGSVAQARGVARSAVSLSRHGSHAAAAVILEDES